MTIYDRIEGDFLSRVLRVVRWAESLWRSSQQDPRARAALDQVRWMKLAETPASGGYWRADAHPMAWSPSGGSGYGTYTEDTDVTLTVQDTTSGEWPVFSGDKVLCRPLGTDEGTVWEIVGGVSMSRWLNGSLTEALAYGADATADFDINGGVVELTVYDAFLKSSQSIPNGSAIGVTWHPYLKKWYATEASC